MKSINTRALRGKNDYNINFKAQLFQRWKHKAYTSIFEQLYMS